jgi:hypothetical protein|tara:strand:+ start:326 stop:511 length:186 start_codon:yes stop_codon:yes gene_type:complete
MAEVAIEMADIQTVLNSTPAFAQAVTAQAMSRRIDELEAEKAEAPACDCEKDGFEAEKKVT